MNFFDSRTHALPHTARRAASLGDSCDGRAMRHAGKGTRRALIAILMLGVAACASPEEKLERYTESGEAFLVEENWGKAKVQFQNALKINEDHVPALQGLVTIAEKRSDFRTMFGLLQRIVRIDPQNLRGRIDLAKFYLLSGDETEAMTSIDEALVLDPRNAEALGVKAAILFRLQNREEALRLARESVAIDPTSQEAVTVIATDMVQREEFDEALAFLDESLRKNPKAAVLHLMRVQILSREGRGEDINAAYKTLIAEFPDEPGYRRLYATNLLREGDIEGARAELLAVSKLLPNEIDA